MYATWANLVLFKAHGKEPPSVADSRSVTGFSVGVLESKSPPEPNYSEVLPSSLKGSVENQCLVGCVFHIIFLANFKGKLEKKRPKNSNEHRV